MNVNNFIEPPILQLVEQYVIIETQRDKLWKYIVKPIFENVRNRMRSLEKIIETTKRPNIYTDFVDAIGEQREIELPGFSAGFDVERFRDKTNQFLKAHDDNDPVIHKLRWNEPLNRSDLEALE